MLAHTIQTDDSLTAELGILAVDPFIEGFNSAIQRRQQQTVIWRADSS